MKKLINVALAGTLSLATLPALAHHSASMFEPVKEFQYTNPHAWLIVEVPGSGGSVTTWSFEMGELSFLTRAGIHKQDFIPGTKVTITGHPMKDGRTAGNFTKAVRADGEVFTARGKAAGSAPTQ